MMRTMLLILLAMLVGCGGCASVPSHDELKATTHRIVARDNKAGAFVICGSTAISPDRLQTAAHCLNGKTLVYVGDTAVQVKTVDYRPDADLATVTLSAPVFRRWAKAGPPPKQGDRLRWWGNPNGIGDVYREGVVATVSGGLVAVDAMTCRGDSGSGLFNASGELVAVMSRLSPEVSPCMFGIGQR